MTALAPRLVGLVAAATVLCVVAPPAALATTRPPAVALVPVVPFAHGPRVLEPTTSFAGYVSEPSGVHSIDATIEVPLIKGCTATSDSGFGPVVILTGKKAFVGAGAEASCEGSTPLYQVAINFNGSESKVLTVHPKDKILVYVAHTKTTTLVKIDDLTTKQKVSQTGQLGAVEAAELGDDTLVDEATNKQLPIPTFVDHGFSACTVDGHKLGNAKPLIAEELVEGKTVLDEPGPLTAGGTAFEMHFEHAS